MVTHHSYISQKMTYIAVFNHIVLNGYSEFRVIAA